MGGLTGVFHPFGICEIGKEIVMGGSFPISFGIGFLSRLIPSVMGLYETIGITRSNCVMESKSTATIQTVYRNRRPPN